MAIFNGDKLKIEIYGESHADKIGVSVSGMPKFTFNADELNGFLSRRKASGQVFSTARKEDDIPVFSGVDGTTVDGKFSADIFNKNVRSSDYGELYGKPRPSHADYAAFLKDGTLDYRGGGRFSGRLTAPLCVAGGIVKQYLKSLGIEVLAYVQSVGKIKGKSYLDGEVAKNEILSAQQSAFPSLSNAGEMLEEIAAAKSDLDSVGGVIECLVFGLKGGVGDNLFGGLEGKISSLIYAVPAVKGVEFGAGFKLTEMRGSAANDQMEYDGGKVKFLTNNSGGINGGISNGNVISMRVALKPTPSIAKKQKTVDLVNKKSVEIEIKGRHDACIVPRAVPCVESAAAIAILDELLSE